jgi:hypothetical protein
MKRFLPILGCALGLALLAGCESTETGKGEQKATQEKTKAQFKRWGEENQRQNLALGERTYDKDFDLVFSAVVTGFADIGLPIRTMERQSGYIFAEGPDRLPENECERLSKLEIAELNKLGELVWRYENHGIIRSTTISVVRLGERKTKVKMRITTPQSYDANGQSFHEEYPPMLEAEYQFMWRALEKQICSGENHDKAQK